MVLMERQGNRYIGDVKTKDIDKKSVMFIIRISPVK